MTARTSRRLLSRISLIRNGELKTSTCVSVCNISSQQWRVLKVTKRLTPVSGRARPREHVRATLTDRPRLQAAYGDERGRKEGYKGKGRRGWRKKESALLSSPPAVPHNSPLAFERRGQVLGKQLFHQHCASCQSVCFSVCPSISDTLGIVLIKHLARLHFTLFTARPLTQTHTYTPHLVP